MRFAVARQAFDAATLAGIALVNVATFTWAGNQILGRALRGSVGPLTLSAARFAIAGLIYAFLLSRRPPQERRLGPDRTLILLMALTGVVLFSPTLYAGLRFTTAVNGTLLNGLLPLMTVVVGAVLVAEPFHLRRLLGGLLGLAGVVLIVTGGQGIPDFAGGTALGDLVVLTALAFWAVYSVLGRTVMERRSALSATALPIIISLPLLLPAALWEQRHLPLRWSPEVGAAMVVIGLFPSLLGFLAWNAGVRRLGSSGAMILVNTLPLYGAILAALFLREPLGWHHLGGGALIVASSLWAARSSD